MTVGGDTGGHFRRQEPRPYRFKARPGHFLSNRKRHSIAIGNHMPAKPGGQCLNRQLTSRKRKKYGCQVNIIARQRKAVQNKKGFTYDCSGAPIAIDKRVIAGNAKSIGGRQVGSVSITICDQIERPRHHAFKHVHVAHASGTAMLGQLLGVGGYSDVRIDPDPVRYLASSRSASRRRAITSRAAAICSAKVASLRRSSTPLDVFETASSSPNSTRRRASTALGKITPVELPILMNLSGLFIQMLEHREHAAAKALFSATRVASEAPLPVRAEFIEARCFFFVRRFFLQHPEGQVALTSCAGQTFDRLRADWIGVIPIQRTWFTARSARRLIPTRIIGIAYPKICRH